MLTFPDFGLVSGDLYAAFRISQALGRIGKPSQIRIGNESSYDELRSSPAVEQLKVSAVDRILTVEEGKGK